MGYRPDKDNKKWHGKEGCGGETGIRTLEGVATLPVFKTGAFNRSAISPSLIELAEIRQICQ